MLPYRRSSTIKKLKMVQDDEIAVSPTPIHVLVADMPEVLSQLVVRLIDEQPDMALAGQVRGRVETLQAAGDGADVLVLGARRIVPLPGICTHLLSAYPHLKILVVTSNGEAAMIYWLGLRRRKLRAVTAGTLLRAIRSAYASGDI